VAQVISKEKILYKAIVLDLDDTLWQGIISEDGIQKIKENMRSESGIPFIEFMKFVRALGNELGLFIAICSRNDSKMIESSLNEFDDDIFPLKNQIDFIIANNNDKSDNIQLISEQLSVLPEAIVFIDDNQIIRDEVKNKMPNVFVPEWDRHSELTTQLMIGCIFERFELSLNSQNRRRQFRIIKSERTRNSLPKLSVKSNIDINHTEAIKLYSKSNQFKFSRNDNNYDTKSKSFYFELIRENGDNLGICSAITYDDTHDYLHVINWAISCRYFEIGLEDYILNYMHNLGNFKNIVFNYNKSDFNQKVSELFERYSFSKIQDTSSEVVELIFTNEIAEKIINNTNLRPI
jgi:FkbH-like protein